MRTHNPDTKRLGCVKPSATDERGRRGLEHVGKTVFCGKANRSKKEQWELKAEKGLEDEAPYSDVNPSGRARRQKGWWKRGVVETKLNTVNMTAWVHKECDIMDEDALLRLQGAWENPQQKNECSVRMDDLEWDYRMGTEVGQLGGFGFQGAIFGVDGSCKDGTMGSGCCKFQGEEADKCARVGREEEGTSSNRPELGGIVLALQSAALCEDVLLLCDNAAVLCAIKKWVGQGGKATLATAPDADILQEIVCLLTQRVRAGRATFLIKVKSHRGETINERADTLAEEGREISDDNKRWDVRTDRMTFEVQKGNTTILDQEISLGLLAHPPASPDRLRTLGVRYTVTSQSRSAENWAANYTYMEYGLSPLGRIKSRRNREMVKEQVRTMTTAEKIASGGDWYISLLTADSKVWVQKNGGVHVVSESA
jgi:ribonuclease HI